MTSLKYLKCSIPYCHNTVGQHSKELNKNKQVCSSHRKKKKDDVDKWKLSRGCENKNGKYGFACVCTNITDPATLDINHVDGDNDNRDPENIEVLCKMCHTSVTIKLKHHLQSKKNKSRRANIEKNKLFNF